MSVVSQGSTSVRVLDPQREATDAWERFVASHAKGAIFHTADWGRAIARALGHTPYLLLAERGGEIVGGLPLTHVRSRLFDNTLVSNGFAVEAGPLACDAQAGQELDQAAVALGERLKVDFVEYRLRGRRNADWAARTDLYATFSKALAGEDEANMKAIPRKQRAMVRKGIANGLESHVVQDVVQLYDIYAESVRNLGTPVFTRRLFGELKRTFGDRCEVLIVTHKGRAVAGVMSFYDGDTVRPYYGGGTAAARDLAANDFMYWEVMRRARARGCTEFDFGRSKVGTGPYSFKKNWGFTPVPLVYEYRLINAQQVPETNPSNPKFRQAIAVWKRLPLPLTKVLGPVVSKGLA
jgi:FemAB-related protein (PEP-CTERM system-associated)